MPLRGHRRTVKALDDLKLDSGKRVTAVMFTIFSGVISGTPVQTGRARGNWFLTQGTPSIVRTDKTNRNSTRQLNRLKAEKVVNKKWYLTNNLPYIEFLEYESRHKGWVRTVIGRTRTNIKRGRL